MSILNRVPLKGEPNFNYMSEEQVRCHVDFIQTLVFAYEQCDKEKANVLRSILKDLANESIDRICQAPFKEKQEEQEEPVPVIKAKLVSRFKLKTGI